MEQIYMEQNHKLITDGDDYLLFVDMKTCPQEIGELFEINGTVKEVIMFTKDGIEASNGLCYTYAASHQIIAYRPKHKDAPVLEGVLLLPELKQEVFDLDAEITKLNTPSRYDNYRRGYVYSEGDILSLFDKVASQKRFDEEDMRNFAAKVLEYGVVYGAAEYQVKAGYTTYLGVVDSYLHLHPFKNPSPVKTPIGFEPETYIKSSEVVDTLQDILSDNYKGVPKEYMKTIKTEEGEVLEGRWIWN